MNSIDAFTKNFPLPNRLGPEHGMEHFAVRVKELSERDRRNLLMHFLALDDNDRLLRFGSVLNDELITRYVQMMNFSRDTVLGVYDDKFMLIGVGHLAFTPREALPLVTDATAKDRVAEFGLSVLPSARGIGVGTRLFERAAVHCRNADVDILTMHCLSTNQTIIHIAKKAGMEIHHAQGEADAYLKLSPPPQDSAMHEEAHEQMSDDHASNTHPRYTVKWLEDWPGGKEN